MRRKSLVNGATSSGKSSQEPSPPTAFSSPKVSRSGGRAMDAGALEALARAFPHGRGHGLQVPDDADEGHELQQVKRDVEFPPIKTLAHRRGVMMVIVVPAFAQGDDGQPHIVAAGVAGLVAPAPEYMRQGVDGVGAVIQGHGGDEESPA